MTQDAFDANDTASSLIELAKALADVETEIQEARRLGSPEVAELAREFNSAQFARAGFLQDLSDQPQNAVQVAYVLAMKLAVDLMTVMRESAALHNAGNRAAAAMQSMKYIMIRPDHDDAARLMRVAEQRVKSIGGPDDDQGEAIGRELEALVREHQYNLQPVIMSLTKTILARDAVRSSAY